MLAFLFHLQCNDPTSEPDWMVGMKASAVSCVQHEAWSRHRRVKRGEAEPGSTMISVPPDRSVEAALIDK